MLALAWHVWLWALGRVLAGKGTYCLVYVTLLFGVAASFHLEHLCSRGVAPELAHRGVREQVYGGDPSRHISPSGLRAG